MDAIQAQADNAPLLWDDIPNNRSFRFRKGDPAAVQAGLAEVPGVTVNRYCSSSLQAMPGQSGPASKPRGLNSL